MCVHDRLLSGQRSIFTRLDRGAFDTTRCIPYTNNFASIQTEPLGTGKPNRCRVSTLSSTFPPIPKRLGAQDTARLQATACGWTRRYSKCTAVLADWYGGQSCPRYRTSQRSRLTHHNKAGKIVGTRIHITFAGQSVPMRVQLSKTRRTRGQDMTSQRPFLTLVVYDAVVKGTILAKWVMESAPKIAIG